MGRFTKFLQTEYKRAAVRLPGILLKAAIPVCIAGMAVFCMQKWFRDVPKEKIKIGFSTEESTYTDYGLRFVEGMDSTKAYCSLEKTGEQAGMEAVKDGSLQALLVLPENTVEGILSGNNVQAKLYLADKTDLQGLVLETLLQAGVGSLQTAQGEIYTISRLAGIYGLDGEQIQSMYNDVDAANLKLYLNREQYFRTRRLSRTENEGAVNYYGSSLLALYFLLTGLFFSAYLLRDGMQEKIIAGRAGIPVGMQLAARFLVLFTGTVCLGVLILSGMLRLPGRTVTLRLSLQTVSVLICGLLAVSAWALLLSCFTGKKSVFPLPVILTAALLGYGAGCVVPRALMPGTMQKLAAYNPVRYLKKAFLSLLSGNTEGTGKTAGILLGTAILCMAIAVFYKKESRHAKAPESFHGMHRQKTHSLPHTGLPAAILRRTLRSKMLWISLLFVLACSSAVGNIEKKSQNQVTAVFYGAEEGMTQLLQEKTGLVTFESCASEEDVKKQILQGKAECGYILQDNLQNELLDGNGNWSITVYENEESTLTKLVNEVLFERVFYQTSLTWFEGYLAEKGFIAEEGGKGAADGGFSGSVKDITDSIIRSGETFAVETLYLSDGQAEKSARSSASTYPVRVMAALCVILCTLTGVLQLVQDKRAKRQHKYHRILIPVLTIGYPLLLGVAAGTVLLWLF